MSFDWSAALGGLTGGLSAGLNAVGSAMSAAQNYKYSKKLQEHQYDLNRKALREQYANTRYSLESAGYNPLLALGSSAQGFSAGASASGGDLSSLGSDMVNSAIQAKQSKAQIDNTYANSALVREQAETEKAKRTQMEFQNAMTDVETHLKRKDLDSYDRRFYSEMYELMQRAENYKATSAINAMNAETNRINAKTSAKQAETARLESDRKHPFQTFGKKIYDEDQKGRSKDPRNIPDPWSRKNDSSSESWWFQPIR